ARCWMTWWRADPRNLSARPAGQGGFPLRPWLRGQTFAAILQDEQHQYLSTLSRKARVGSAAGALNNWAAGPASTIRPSARKATWSATRRAKPISWVTR